MHTSNQSRLGSKKWIENVFLEEPARVVQGRSRPTQRYLTTDRSGHVLFAEGGGASIARSLLETMSNAGVVRRFKLEPFTLTREDHGIDATPDNLFQTFNDETFVVEVKSSRFLTAEKIEKCLQVQTALAPSGMKYLLWTDTSPLPPALWQLLREMRRLGFSALPRESVEKVIQAISEGPKTVGELRQLGIYRDVLLAAAWHGAAHFNLNNQFSEATIVSSDVNARQFVRLLQSTLKNQRWWSGLPQSYADIKSDGIKKSTQSRERVDE